MDCKPVFHVLYVFIKLIFCIFGKETVPSDR